MVVRVEIQQQHIHGYGKMELEMILAQTIWLQISHVWQRTFVVTVILQMVVLQSLTIIR